MLSETMDGRLVPKGERVEFPTELIIRGSTGPAPADQTPA
jgi:hypothetical protein